MESTENPTKDPVVIEWDRGKYGGYVGKINGLSFTSIGRSSKRGDPLPWQLSTQGVPRHVAFETVEEAQAEAERQRVAQILALGGRP